MRLYSYVVRWDYGFAPNPFFGACTLATCKPEIRRTGAVGDWIVGTGSRQKGNDERLVYWMQVAEVMTLDAYWRDERFRRKRPNLRKSLKYAFGDNIYHWDRSTGKWMQEDSHHSREKGRVNAANRDRDVRVDRVLVAFEFAYWGGSGPRIPKRFRRPGGDVRMSGQGHRCRFPEKFSHDFVGWLMSCSDRGLVAEPREFPAQLKKTRPQGE